MPKFCTHCGCEYGKEGSHDENAVICPVTGLPLTDKPIPTENKTGVRSQKNKLVAGRLAMLLGFLGVHKFYHGSWGWGLLYVSVLLLLGSTAGFFQFKSQQEEQLHRQRMRQHRHLQDIVNQDAYYYVKTHFDENKPEFLDNYLSNWDSISMKGYLETEKFLTRKYDPLKDIVMSDFGRMEREQIRSIAKTLDTLAETGVRQSAKYDEWRQFDSNWHDNFLNEISAVLGISAFVLGIILEIIGIAEGIALKRMSKEQYDAKYNEMPAWAFKW